MELKQYALALWKWKWLIVIATLLPAGLSYWTESQAPPVYRTTTTLMVGQFLQSANPQGGDFSLGQQLAQGYALMVRREPLLQAVVESLGLSIPPKALAGQVSAAAVPNAPLIQITVADRDPERARLIADEVARQLILQSPTPQERDQEERRQFVNEQLTSLQARITDAETEMKDLDEQLARETSARGIRDVQSQIAALQAKINAWQGNYAALLDFFRGGRVNYLSVVDPAPPAAPVKSAIPLNTLVAAAIGFALAAGAALLLEYLDDTLKHPEDVSQRLGLPTLGTITRVAKIKEVPDRLVLLNQPRSWVSEEYRALRTSIQFRTQNSQVARLLITSAVPGEGKTTTACNLAVALAQAGKRVILCDADLRRPTVHQLFGLANTAGLTSLVLDASLPLETVLLETTVPELKVIPSGPPLANPGDLLGSSAMRERLAQMEKHADVIVIDSPATLALADATIIGALTTDVVLVVAAGRTRGGLIRQARAALEEVGLIPLGVILNKLAPHPSPGFTYYQTHESDDRPDGGARRKMALLSRGGVGILARGNGSRDAAGEKTE